MDATPPAHARRSEFNSDNDEVMGPGSRPGRGGAIPEHMPENDPGSSLRCGRDDALPRALRLNPHAAFCGAGNAAAADA